MKFGQILDIEEAKRELSIRLIKARDELSLKESTDSLNPKIITNRELSRRAGISPSYVDNMMAGNNIPSLNIFFKISTALERDPLQMIKGLERFIVPKNFSVETGDSIEEVNYLKIVKMDLDKYLSTIELDKKDKIKLIPTDEFYIEVEDNSMEALGLKKGSTVFWKEHSATPINGRLYVIKLDNQKIIRKVWIIKDRIILIPCALSLDYEIEEYPKTKVEIIGVPITVKRML